MNIYCFMSMYTYTRKYMLYVILAIYSCSIIWFVSRIGISAGDIEFNGTRREKIEKRANESKYALS